MRRVGFTTWLVLSLCLLVGVVAVAMTAVVIVRLNRQILASAAELRTGLAAVPPGTPGDNGRAELLQYAAAQVAIENQWAETVAEYRLRYPNDAIYSSVITAQTVRTINAMRRPTVVGPLHERWAQAWSDRDSALALLARPDASDEDRQRANELARRAGDELRRVNNELRDLLVAQGATEQELTAALGPLRATP